MRILKVRYFILKPAFWGSPSFFWVTFRNGKVVGYAVLLVGSRHCLGGSLFLFFCSSGSDPLMTEVNKLLQLLLLV